MRWGGIEISKHLHSLKTHPLCSGCHFVTILFSFTVVVFIRFVSTMRSVLHQFSNTPLISPKTGGSCRFCWQALAWIELSDLGSEPDYCAMVNNYCVTPTHKQASGEPRYSIRQLWISVWPLQLWCVVWIGARFQNNLASGLARSLACELNALCPALSILERIYVGLLTREPALKSSPCSVSPFPVLRHRRGVLCEPPQTPPC